MRFSRPIKRVSPSIPPSFPWYCQRVVQSGGKGVIIPSASTLGGRFSLSEMGRATSSRSGRLPIILRLLLLQCSLVPRDGVLHAMLVSSSWRWRDACSPMRNGGGVRRNLLLGNLICQHMQGPHSLLPLLIATASLTGHFLAMRLTKKKKHIEMHEIIAALRKPPRHAHIGDE